MFKRLGSFVRKHASITAPVSVGLMLVVPAVAIIVAAVVPPLAPIALGTALLSAGAGIAAVGVGIFTDDPAENGYGTLPRSNASMPSMIKPVQGTSSNQVAKGLQSSKPTGNSKQKVDIRTTSYSSLPIKNFTSNRNEANVIDSRLADSNLPGFNGQK